LSTKKLYDSVVVNVIQVAQEIYILRLHEPELCQGVHAGQFVEVKVPHCSDLLWRRPFSIHNIHLARGTIDILFNAVGRGTAAMCHLKSGDVCNILGPLGNHFQYDDSLDHAIVVAGGLGIAPFMLLQRELADRAIPMHLFYGAGSKEQLCHLDVFEQYADVHVSTMDGSMGFKGLVTELLLEFLETFQDRSHSSLYVCGPTPMLRRVKEIAKEFGIPAQVSVETIMACGFGACVGCAVPMVHPRPGVKEYYLACVDGPVFNMENISIND